MTQFHAADYRNPDQLPGGTVLVVGSAQSGSQITEDLLAAGQSAVLATSRVGRAPARHRGRDTVALLLDCGFFQQRRDELPDSAVITAPQPLLAPGGRSISLQELARAGATLTGRLIGVDGHQLTFDHTLHANIAYGDAFADRIRAMLDHQLIGSDSTRPKMRSPTRSRSPPIRRPTSTCGRPASPASSGAPATEATSPGSPRHCSTATTNPSTTTVPRLGRSPIHRSSMAKPPRLWKLPRLPHRRHRHGGSHRPPPCATTSRTVIARLLPYRWVTEGSLCRIEGSASPFGLGRILAS